MAAKKVIIVGGGIIGAAFAFELARNGATVTLVDAAPQVGGLATTASFAWINASSGNPEPYFRLRYRSMQLWRTLESSVPGLQVQWTGSLLWDEPDRGLAAYVRERQDQGYDIRLVEAGEVRQIEPALRHVPGLAAHAPCEGAIEPVPAVETLLSAARCLGALIHHGTSVFGLVEKAGRVRGVLTNSGLIEADEIVLAAGIGTSRLLEPLGFSLPVKGPDGLLIRSIPVEKILNGLVLSPHLHVRQCLDGSILAGGDFGGSDPGENAEEVARDLFAELQALFIDGDKLRYQSFGIGSRPIPADGFPAIGLVRGLAGVYIAVSHSGVTLAPALATFGTREILDGLRDPLLGPYSPSRFAGFA